MFRVAALSFWKLDFKIKCFWGLALRGVCSFVHVDPIDTPPYRDGVRGCSHMIWDDSAVEDGGQMLLYCRGSRTCEFVPTRRCFSEVNSTSDGKAG